MTKSSHLFDLGWIRADRAPDVLGEQVAGDVVASGLIKAVETCRPRVIIGAVSHSAANFRGVAPDQLSEVAPRVLVARVVVRVLGLLLVPAVDDSASEFQPLIVVGRGRTPRREVAATAIMLGHVGAHVDRLQGCLGQSWVPLEVLGTVDAAPVPVSIHDAAYEFMIVDMRSRAVNRVASLDGFAWSCGCGASGDKSDERGKLHDGDSHRVVPGSREEGDEGVGGRR